MENTSTESILSLRVDLYIYNIVFTVQIANQYKTYVLNAVLTTIVSGI